MYKIFIENVKNCIEISKDIKESIINKLIENEKCMQNDERTFTEDDLKHL